MYVGLLPLPLVMLPWVGRVAIALVEGVGAMDVAATLEVVEEVEDLGENTGWHDWLSAQTIGIVIDVVKMLVVSGEIMMASISFEIQLLELILLFCFYFVVSVLFDPIDE